MAPCCRGGGGARVGRGGAGGRPACRSLTVLSLKTGPRAAWLGPGRAPEPARPCRPLAARRGTRPGGLCVPPSAPEWAWASSRSRAVRAAPWEPLGLVLRSPQSGTGNIVLQTHLVPKRSPDKPIFKEQRKKLKLTHTNTEWTSVKDVLNSR